MVRLLWERDKQCHIDEEEDALSENSKKITLSWGECSGVDGLPLRRRGQDSVPEQTDSEVKIVYERRHGGGADVWARNKAWLLDSLNLEHCS